MKNNILDLFFACIFFLLALYGLYLPPHLVTTIFIIISLCVSVTLFTLSFKSNDNVKIIGIIPARMASTRFPGKPLAKINGVPMIEHVWRNVMNCKTLDNVVVASCDTEILNHVESIGGNVMMTMSSHKRATDRVVEAAKELEMQCQKYGYVVMVQGDEPMVTPEMINEAIQPILNGEATVTNLMYLLILDKDINDVNTIKVVTDKQCNALYFSRSPIPFQKGCLVTPFKQVCVMGFTRDALLQFSELSSTPLEQAESIDMLRYLEHNIPVKMVRTKTSTHSVDTPKDLKFVEKLMKGE